MGLGSLTDTLKACLEKLADSFTTLICSFWHWVKSRTFSETGVWGTDVKSLCCGWEAEMFEKGRARAFPIIQVLGIWTSKTLNGIKLDVTEAAELPKEVSSIAFGFSHFGLYYGLNWLTCNGRSFLNGLFPFSRSDLFFIQSYISFTIMPNWIHV